MIPSSSSIKAAIKNARHHEGKKVNVEYGPVLWVQFTEWPAAAPAPAATK
jgi:hypothetical protein